MEDIRIKRWITFKGRRLPVGEDGKIIKLQNKEVQNVKNSYDREAVRHRLTNANIEYLIDSSIAEYDEDYAKNYITRMSPKDYLKLTANESVMDRLENEKFDLDLDTLDKEGSWIYLSVDMEKGKVIGHEGRHRMYSLKNSGYEDVDVVVFPSNYEKYHAKEYRYRKLTGQEEMGLQNNSVVVDNLIPVSKKNIERIRNRKY